MIEAPAYHPGDAALLALSLGQLAEAEFAHVSSHLGDCPQCCRRIDQLASDDVLVALLKQSAARRGEVIGTPDEHLSAVRALRRFHVSMPKVRPQDPDACAGSGIASGSAVQPTPDWLRPRRRADDVTQFLADSERPDEIGRLGPYRILDVLGQGGMGVVFRAHDPALDRLVALKTMRPGIAGVPAARKRFVREAKAAAALKHPHVVTVFHVGEDRGVPFLAMEYLEGEPLDVRLRREGRLPLADALRIGRETALGLAAAHTRGLVHRDIKPANLWLEGPTGHVKILDFGLAHALADQAHLTQLGMLVGTLAYMAPEQAEGKPVDPRCDLFSLGCILYQMLTGARPYQGETAIAVLRTVALHSPAPLGDVRPDAPPELLALLVRLLAKNPEDRPATAQEVAETLRSLELLPPTPVARESAKRPAPRSRKPRGAIAGAALVLGLVALTVVLWPTPRGTVRIESDDPEVKVVFDKDGPRILGADKETITLPAGEHAVFIKRGDFTFEAETLILKQGAAVTLTVELWNGKVRVMQHGNALTTQAMPLPAKLRDEAWFKRVRALPAPEQDAEVASRLWDLNPGFDGQVFRRYESVGQRFEMVTDRVTNFSPLRALTNVSVLSCTGSAPGKGHLVDMETLRALQPIGLNCFSTNVSDLAPLAVMKLIYIDFSHTNVADLGPLRGMPMTYLYCRGCPKVESLAPLEGMPLKHFNCTASGVADLAPLRGMKMERFWAGLTKVKDLAPLRGMPLELLSIHTTPVANLEPLQGMKLRELNCVQTNVTDLSVLRGMPLRILSCDFQAKRDAAILRSIKTLEQINGKSAQAFWNEVDAMPDAQKP
jgi:serine/threonine protein kinase